MDIEQFREIYEGTFPVRSWYVGHNVSLGESDAESVTLPRLIETGDGITASITPVAPAKGVEGSRYAAVFAIDRLITVNVPVEIEVVPTGMHSVEIGIRPAGRTPGLFVGQKTYFEAAWAVIDALAEQFAQTKAAARAA